jgi:hypothetical protein
MSTIIFTVNDDELFICIFLLFGLLYMYDMYIIPPCEGRRVGARRDGMQSYIHTLFDT